MDNQSKKNAIILWTGDWTSRIGNTVFDYANSLLLISVGPNAERLLALYQSSEKIIGVLVTLLGGIVADGNKKKNICVITDIISSLVCFVVAILCENQNIGIYIVVANVVLAVLSAFNKPTYKSIIREMIDINYIVRFNAIGRCGAEITRIAAPILALCLVNVIGIKGALLFDGITFFVSALIELFLHPLYAECKKKEYTLTSEMKNLVKYIVSDKWVLYMIILYTMVNYILAAYNLMLPFTENIFVNQCKNFYGKALLSEAIGGLTASLLCARTTKKNYNYVEVAVICSGLMLTTIPKVTELNIWMVFIVYSLFSFTTVIFNISYSSELQVKIDREYVGKIFGFINALAMLAVPISTSVFAIIFNMEVIENYYVIGGMLFILGVISRVVLGRIRGGK